MTTLPQALTAPLAITLGDPCGIGPEIVLKSLQCDPSWMNLVVCVGDLGVLERTAAALRWQKGFRAVNSVRAALDLRREQPHVLPVVQVGDCLPNMPLGQVDARAGAAAQRWVEWAANAALRGEVAGLVTAPLHKAALAAAGCPYPGHTELLQANAAAFLELDPSQLPVRMMLANNELRTVLTSIHVSLRQAIDAITVDSVLETLRITHAHGLRCHPGERWRIAVAGLNPHAGEGGLFGQEETLAIAPAIEVALSEGMDVHGPISPDTVFMRARSVGARPGEFDVVVAMYHDQGLIPVKYLGVADGVNVTLGLPFIRTSPDHGTAFDIAGKYQADPSSFLTALKSAFALAVSSKPAPRPAVQHE